MQLYNHKQKFKIRHFFADDQVIPANSEGKLHYSAYNLQETAKDFNMEITIVKTKIMTFQEKCLIYSKILFTTKLWTTLSDLNIFVIYYIMYENEKDICEKILNLQQKNRNNNTSFQT
jgi:hypothetical protein